MYIYTYHVSNYMRVNKYGPDRKFKSRTYLGFNIEQHLKEELEEESRDEGISVTDFIGRSISERIARKKESGLEKPISCLSITSLIKHDASQPLTVDEILLTIEYAKTYEDAEKYSYVVAAINDAVRRRTSLFRFKGIKREEQKREIVFNGRQI